MRGATRDEQQHAAPRTSLPELNLPRPGPALLVVRRQPCERSLAGSNERCSSVEFSEKHPHFSVLREPVRATRLARRRPTLSSKVVLVVTQDVRSRPGRGDVSPGPRAKDEESRRGLEHHRDEPHRADAGAACKRRQGSRGADVRRRQRAPGSGIEGRLGAARGPGPLHPGRVDRPLHRPPGRGRERLGLRRALGGLLDLPRRDARAGRGRLGHQGPPGDGPRLRPDRLAPGLQPGGRDLRLRRLGVLPARLALRPDFLV
jgi:hypothetical protein